MQHLILEMQSLYGNKTQISLSNWPCEPININKIRISPKTSKILKKSKVNLKQLIPQSFKQFQMNLNESQKQFSDAQEMYTQQNKRRIKKIEILKSIWKKQSKDNNTNYKKYRKTFKTVKSKRSCNSVNNPARINSLQDLIRKDNTRTVHTERKASAFQQYYNGISHKAHKKQPFCDQSTKSKKLNPYHPNYQKSLSKKKKNSKKNQSQLRTLELLNELMKKWSLLQNQQSVQQHFISHNSDLSPKQKNRLTKIHNIERQQIKFQIQKIKKRIRSLKQFQSVYK